MSAALFACCCSCGDIMDRDKNMQIIIKYGHKARFDFKQDTYTVYYQNGDAKEVPLQLNQDERNDLVNKYYEQKLSKMDSVTVFEDTCGGLATHPIEVFFTTHKRKHQVTIGDSCDVFKAPGDVQGYRMHKYLWVIMSMLEDRRIVRELPPSDIVD
ncbi:hypothetical protein [Filimonas lacunae]|nr:hypothetical protein [Filimonas lacunae]